MRATAVLVVVLCLTACGGGPPPPMAMPPPAVGVARPIVRELPIERVLTGRIEPIDIVEVAARVSGTVARTVVRSGATVAAGDALFELDQAPFRLAVERSAAAVAAGEVALRQARETSARNDGLRRDGLISEQQAEDARRAVEAADAALAGARAALAQARLELEWTTVRAPIAGKLGLMNIAVGSQVMGGGMMPPTVVTTLMPVAPVYAAFDLDEASYQRLAPSIAASISGQEPLPVRVGVAGSDDWPFVGRIVFVDNHVDPASGTIRLRALLTAAPDLPPPGAFARIALRLTAPRPVALVHEQAIQAQLATRFVLAVGEGGATSVVPVQPGTRHGVLREVPGLDPTTLLVVSNTAKVLAPGMPVAGFAVDMETLQAVDGK